MSGIKIITGDGKTKYFFEGKEYDKLPTSWKSNTLDQRQLELKNKRPSVLVGERIGESEDDGVDDNGLLLSITETAGASDNEIIFYYTLFDEELPIDSDDVANVWFINGDKVGSQSVLSISLDELEDVKNNIIKLVCEYDGRTVTEYTNTFKNAGGSGNGNSTIPPSQPSYVFNLSPKKIVYNESGGLITNESTVRVDIYNVDGNKEYKFYIDGELVYEGEQNSYKITRSQFPDINGEKIIRGEAYVDGELQESKEFKMYSSVDFDKRGNNSTYEIQVVSNNVPVVDERVSFIIFKNGEEVKDSNSPRGRNDDQLIGEEEEKGVFVENIIWNFNDGSDTKEGFVVDKTFSEAKNYKLECEIVLSDESSESISKIIKVNDK